MELEYLKVANNPIMWISVLPGVLLVIVQAIVLSRRALVSGRKMGITERQFKSAIRSSALASIGPSLIIVTGMIALLSSMGGPIAWMRLAYIGAVNFELSAADRAASAVGCTLGTSNMTMEAFACAVYTMVICCLGWILVSALFAHKMGDLRDRVAGNNKAKMSVISVAGGMGAYGYQCFNRGIVLAGPDAQTMTVIFGFGIMFALAIYGKKKNVAWVRKFGMMIAMFSGMLLGSFFL